MGNWEDLPTDLLLTVSSCIARTADYIRFRAVCSSWRCGTDDRPAHLPRQVPFLLLPGESFTFYSPTEDRSYLVPFPNGNQYHCLGSSHGWLFLMGPNITLFLLNPFSRTMVSLPPVVEIPNLLDQVTPTDVERYRALMGRGELTSTVGFWKYFLHRGKLCFDRKDTWGFWIAIAFLKSGLAFYRPEDKSWAHACRFWQFNDAELYNGKLYAITRGGILSIIDMSGSFKETVVVHSSPFLFSQDVSYYLVDADEYLLLVVRKYSLSLTGSRRTVGFEVFKLETEEPGWKRVENLGDHCILLERGTSLCLPASGFEGFEGNYIYFTGGYDPCEEDKYKGMDLGCYGLEEGNMRPLLCCNPCAKSAWPGPTWVTPCLW